MSKHTPGRWIVGPLRKGQLQGPVVYAAGSPTELQIADCRNVWEYRLSPQECVANASLISAAPDLFEVAERLLKELDGGHGDLTVGLMEDAVAAIAKAKGVADK